MVKNNLPRQISFMAPASTRVILPYRNTFDVQPTVSGRTDTVYRALSVYAPRATGTSGSAKGHTIYS